MTPVDDLLQNLLDIDLLLAVGSETATCDQHLSGLYAFAVTAFLVGPDLDFRYCCKDRSTALRRLCDSLFRPMRLQIIAGSLPLSAPMSPLRGGPYRRACSPQPFCFGAMCKGPSNLEKTGLEAGLNYCSPNGGNS